ncbi:MAG: hypothetical protein H0W64_08235 [Gammaproteobacteria bacterium]|nr:hypothetical protein [Gammaproteobacteria bacterium]
MQIAKVFKYAFLLSLTLASFQTFAHQGKGYRIISETTETSPGAVGGIMDVTQTRPPLGYASALANAPNQHSHRNQYSYVEGNHGVTIRNNTAQNQLYKYIMEVNCDNRLFRSVKHIELFPEGTFTNQSKSFVVVQEEKVGTFPIKAMTQVIGESNSSFEGQGKLVVEG